MIVLSFPNVLIWLSSPDMPWEHLDSESFPSLAHSQCRDKGHGHSWLLCWALAGDLLLTRLKWNFKTKGYFSHWHLRNCATGSGIYLSLLLIENTKYLGLFLAPSMHFSKRKAEILNLWPVLEKSLLSSSLSSNVAPKLPLIILVT